MALCLLYGPHCNRMFTYGPNCNDTVSTLWILMVMVLRLSYPPHSNGLVCLQGETGEIESEAV